MPAAMRLQKSRVWPRLSNAFLVETKKAAAIITCGTRSPMIVRKKGLGNTSGASAKPANRAIPLKSAEIWSRDTAWHDKPSARFCLDHGAVTLGYRSNLEHSRR